MEKTVLLLSLVYTLALAAIGCSHKPDATVIIDTQTVINDHYIGNGAQWDPYQLDYGKIQLKVSDEDWQKLYDRLDFMRPRLMRVTINIGSYIQDGRLNPKADGGQLIKILEYCHNNDVTVMFGDWGHDLIYTEEKLINRQNIAFAAELTEYLIREKGLASVKYFNIVNEPNGFWSSTEGSYPLWREAATYLHEQFKDWKLTDDVSIVGPDVAIWTPDEAWWIDSTATDLGEAVGLYDIHTYPSKVTVNSGAFAEIIRAYKDKVPAGKKIVMGEIGFKFVKDADSLLQKENIRRAKAKEYASVDDSQMFVYDYMYGTDMADALFQTVNAGYSGSVVWMLDDAMHSKEERHKLKVWGFWNIFGEEFFGAEEEQVRPWYYAWSLLTKYMPSGSKVYKTEVTGDGAVKAIAVEKDGKYMLAVVNTDKSERTVRLKSTGLASLDNMKKFVYAEQRLITKGDHQVLPNERGLTLHLNEGTEIHMPSESLIVYTNFGY